MIHPSYYGAESPILLETAAVYNNNNNNDYGNNKNNNNKRRRRRCRNQIRTRPITTIATNIINILLLFAIIVIQDISHAQQQQQQQQQENTRTLLGLGSQECMDCTGLNSNCVGTTISDTHCTPCSTGQSWWPCNIANECYCKKLTSRPTDRPTDKPTVYSSGMPTVERPSSSPMPTIDPKNLIMRPGSSSSGSGGSGNIDGGDGGGGKYSYNEQIISRYEISRSKLHPSILEGLYVMDAHLAANKIVLVRELLMSPGIGGGGSGGRGGDGGYSYTGFRSSLHTMITSTYKFVCVFYLFNRE